jgi:hypothetical protein
MNRDKQPRPGVPVPPKGLVDDVLSVSPPGSNYTYACAFAAWGADEQLRLCMEWLADYPAALPIAESMKRELRPKPKPPSLKQEALDVLSELHALKNAGQPLTWGFTGEAIEKLRKAVEALPDDN